MWNERKLSRLAQKILKTLKVRSATLDIILLDNVKMAALKTRFIKKKTEPNVLSFPSPRTFRIPKRKSAI